MKRLGLKDAGLILSGTQSPFERDRECQSPRGLAGVAGVLSEEGASPESLLVRNIASNSGLRFLIGQQDLSGALFAAHP